MKKQKDEIAFPLSYESDGKMGQDKKEGKRQAGTKEAEQFFNQTQNSE